MDDRPCQNPKKDSAEYSKPKDRKRKGDNLVVATDRSRSPRAPRSEDFKKVMDATCPFHPKGKHAVKDCYSLQDYIKEHIKNPAQGTLDQNQDQQQGGPAFPDPEHQLNMIFGGSAAYESKRKRKLIAREINVLTPATPKYL